MSNGWQSGRTADEIRSGEVDASIDAVLTDEDAIANIMLAAERAGIADESPLVETLSREQRSRTIREARQSGDSASMSMATGLSESTVEATGYQRLIDRCTPAAQQILIKGPKGSGKTVAALDLMRRLYAEFDGELEIFTNIRGPDEHDAVTFGETMSEMLEWVRDTSGEKLVVGDEWSTTMNAHAHPGGNIRQTVSQFINALRKGSGGSTRLVIVGHEHDSDIAAIIRTQADVILEKSGKADEGLADQAAIYDGWTDYQAGEEALKVRGLQDVPESSVWGAQTNYFAHFEPDLDAPDKQIQRGKLIEDWRQYQDDADDVDEEGEGPATPLCAAETNAGDPCPHDAAYPDDDPLVCRAHRGRLEDLQDDDRDDDGETRSEEATDDDEVTDED